MKRQSRILMYVAATALLSMWVGTTQGHAAEFHCSVEPCRYTALSDGTGKTAHQVFLIENAAQTEVVSLTCGGMTGEAITSSKTANQISLGVISFQSCLINGSPFLTIVMNGCDLLINSTGHMSITTCEAGKSIEARIGTGCVFTVGEQTTSGVTYHTLGTTPNREITLSKSISNVAVTADGSAPTCLINPNQTLTLTQTTGNIILRGESPGGVYADAWFE